MSVYKVENKKKVTTVALQEMKLRGEKIAMLTSYDYNTARLVDAAGIDTILVGDSAANVKAGYATTLPITMDEMIVYARSVAKAVKRAFVVCDMPFGSYQVSIEQGLSNAIRLVKEAGVDAVKIEGGERVVETVRRIVEAGIPVCGHLGLTPQSVNVFGGYGLRAAEESEAETLLRDAKLLERAGVYAIVLEKIPAELAARVTSSVSCPTIGIGAGSSCDGQVLVCDDMLGMNEDFSPKFLRRYAHLGEVITDAVSRYVDDVKSRNYPSTEESY